MSTKAYLLMLSTTIFLLFVLFRLSPFCVYKIDYDGGYILCVSVFKKIPPISYGNTVELSDSYNSFNDQKHKLPPAIDEKEDAVKLSDKNFSHVIAKNQHVMVLFMHHGPPRARNLLHNIKPLPLSSRANLTRPAPNCMLELR